MKLEISRSYLTKDELFLRFEGKFFSYQRVINLKSKPKKKRDKDG
jgi:hypothetical protein